MIEILDPTYGDDAPRFEAAPRLKSLDGVTVGIISNGKHGTAPFFDALATELQATFGVEEVVRLVKPNYSAPAGDELLNVAATWHALITGVGD